MNPLRYVDFHPSLVLHLLKRKTSNDTSNLIMKFIMPSNLYKPGTFMSSEGYYDHRINLIISSYSFELCNTCFSPNCYCKVVNLCNETRIDDTFIGKYKNGSYNYKCKQKITFRTVAFGSSWWHNNFATVAPMPIAYCTRSKKRKIQSISH